MLKPPRLRPKHSAVAVVFLTGCVLVGSDGGRVEHKPVQVRFLQGLEDVLPDAFNSPAAEALIDRVPGTIAFGKVAPGSTTARNPEHGIQKKTVILSCTANISGFAGQQLAYTFPCLVTDFLAPHNVFKLLTTTIINHSLIVNTT